MTELKDYSGAVKENLKLEDMSKEFLVKLAKEWQGDYLKGCEIYHSLVQEKLGKEEADKMETVFFTKQAQACMPRIAKVANIKVKDVADMVKVMQLTVDGIMGFQPDCTYEIINRDHVIITIKRCLNLEYFEKFDPGRIMHVCHYIEEKMMNDYCHIFLPDMKVKMLKLPPRKGPDEIACKWEWKRGK